MPRNLSLSLAVVALSGGIPSPSAAADDPPPAIGTVQTVPVVSVALEVGSTEKESKRVVYAPPPGWYVRSHRVECGHRHGLASYTVSTVPAGWKWSSDEAAADAARAKLTAAGGTHVARFGGDAAAEWDESAAARQRTLASHHSLVVDVSARGAGLWRGGGGIELTVVAEMVYVGGAGR